MTKRQITFCQLWVEKGNATRAYIEAGLPGRNENVAAVEAFRLLRKPKIREYIRELQHAAAESAKTTVAGLAAEFRRVTQARITSILGQDGEVLPPDQWPEDVQNAIVRLEVEELSEMQPDPDNPRRKKKVAIGTKWKVWLENKTECRKVLAQWLGMIGANKTADKTEGHAPLVVGGEANPDNL